MGPCTFKRTRRTDDLPLLLAIRRGDYMQADGTFSQAFYEILEEYERKLDEAAAKTTLPDNPDMDKVEKFVERINRIAITEEYTATHSRSEPGVQPYQ